MTEGTAKRYGDVPGYAVAGKTGTSEKQKKNGPGYDKDRVLASFASVFPAHDPQYVLVVTMDEAVETAYKKALPNGTVLLSPACASFDWYESYSERGLDFIRAVSELKLF